MTVVARKILLDSRIFSMQVNVRVENACQMGFLPPAAASVSATAACDGSSVSNSVSYQEHLEEIPLQVASWRQWSVRSLDLERLRVVYVSLSLLSIASVYDIHRSQPPPVPMPL